MTRTTEGMPEGNRFSALLNPIRDLAASWGIDVAKELSDYAESLGIDVNENDNDEGHDGFPVPVDFAEAALLVQGSTSIYSRKVEHLYSLVYIAVSALNLMVRKGKGAPDGLCTTTNDDAEADALLDMDEIDFLTLDDDVPQADPKAITLGGEPHQLNSFFRDATTLPPIPPMLMHRSGDAAIPVGGVTYKMATAHTHPSGALIMEGCPPVSENLDTLPTEKDLESDVDVTQPFDNNFADYDDCGRDDILPKSPGGSQFDIARRKESLEAVKTNEALVAGSRAIKETAELYRVTSPRETRMQPKAMKDPLLMLDPHQSIANLDKPVRIGRTYRKPRRRLCTAKSTDFYEVEKPEGVDVSNILLGEIPQSACIKSFVSFAGIRPPYAAILRKRRAQQRRRLILQNKNLTNTVEFEYFDDEEAAGAPDVESHLFQNVAGFEHGDDDELDSPEHLRLPGGPDDVQENHPDLGLFTDPENDQQLGSQLAFLASSYEETCRKHLEKTAWMWEQRTTDVNLIKRVEEWTVRIQPLLEEEDQRQEFDISLYSEAVLTKFDQLRAVEDVEKTKISLLLQQPTKFDVCRLFLATLQLANNRAIEIIPPQRCMVSDFFVKHINGGKSGDPIRGMAKGSDHADEFHKTSMGRSKRSRQPGSTPRSARRQPLRPRLQIRNLAE